MFVGTDPWIAISQLLEKPIDDIALSFEFFPPKKEAATANLQQTVAMLAPLEPRFVSVTCGAGGSTSEHTQATAKAIARDTGIDVAAHLTCVGASRDEIDRQARAYWDDGVRHIVALRGDPVHPGARFEAMPDGYGGAAELVAGLKRVAPFEISVAAYPECHPDSPNWAADLDNLWRKFDAGADRAITQFFFSADHFLRFRDRAAAVGIDAEIVPGILAISNMTQTRKFANQCGASIPPWISRIFDGLTEHQTAQDFAAATIAAQICAQLYAGGVRQFHFYTLNRADLPLAICHLLGCGRKEPPLERRRIA